MYARKQSYFYCSYIDIFHWLSSPTKTQGPTYVLHYNKTILRDPKRHVHAI